jgi:hypothetical protein
MHWFAWWKMCIPKKQGGMAFRDIQSFNLALLAKQAWRLLVDLDSLCATVLRAKYFPEGDLLNYKLKKGSSYSWQRIWAGIQTFKRGAIWHVGDDSNINIWEDCWISSSPSHGVMTPRGNIVLTKVSKRISSESRTWDEELLNSLF